MNHIWYAAAGLAPLPPLPFDLNALDQFGLRDYQRRIIYQVVLRWLEGYRRILIQLPTGGGKTVIASALHGSSAVLGHPSQFLVHRKELIDQTSRTLARAGIEHGLVASGEVMDFDAMVIVAGIQTLVNRLDLVRRPLVVLVDEAHHGTSTTYQRVLDSYPPDTLILGLTASPQRLDGRGLDEQFEVMVLGPTPAELIAAGHLCRYEFYGPDAPDLSEVGDVGGEYNRKGAAAVMERQAIIGNIVAHYLELAPGKQGIGFAVSREHSRKMVEAFRASGVRAAHLDGDTPKDERRAVDAAYRRGEIDMLWNVDLFGEGYDVPGAVYLADAAPTKSLVKVLQRWGRVLRPAPGKECGIIADHAGNHTRHGLPDTEREWSLAGRDRKTRGSPSDAVGTRTCLVCYRISESGTQVCPGCDTPFPAQDRTVEEREGKLTKIEKEMLAKKNAALRKAEERACKSEAELVALAQARGYQNPVGWARMRMKFRNNWRG